MLRCSELSTQHLHNIVMPPRTIIEKLWDAHVVHEQPGAPTLLYIDLHLVHEVTSPQAFQGLRDRGLKVRRPDLTVATTDHSTPTTRPFAADRGRDRRQAGRAARNQLPRFRDPLLWATQRPAGDRARDRSRAGLDAARHDRGLRRQPHRHARRVRRAGLRHRHQRSGARAGHAVPAAAQIENVSRCRWMARCATVSRPRTSSWL